METKIQALITKLMDENKDRSIAMNDENCSQYAHTVLVSKYNTTIEFIKQLEAIVKP